MGKKITEERRVLSPFGGKGGGRAWPEPEKKKREKGGENKQIV